MKLKWNEIEAVEIFSQGIKHQQQQQHKIAPHRDENKISCHAASQSTIDSQLYLWLFCEKSKEKKKNETNSKRNDGITISSPPMIQWCVYKLIQFHRSHIVLLGRESDDNLANCKSSLARLLSSKSFISMMTLSCFPAKWHDTRRQKTKKRSQQKPF